MNSPQRFPSKNILVAILVIALLACLLSVLSHLDKNSGVCDIVGNGCDSVQSTNYGQLLGLELNILGIIAFALLALLTIIQLAKPQDPVGWLIILGCVLAGLFALYLIGVQIFILRQVCAYCITIDAASIALLGVAVYAVIRRRNV